MAAIIKNVASVRHVYEANTKVCAGTSPLEFMGAKASHKGAVTPHGKTLIPFFKTFLP